MWWVKFFFCLIYDIWDFTIGRLMFATPFLGEIIGVLFGCLLFGSKGFYYALEAIDPTEQIDGFIPTATLIAIAAKKDYS